MTKVRIVCRDYDGDKILPRKARWLADGLGWSLGERPDPDAWVNYYFCYIEYAEKFCDWRKKTLTMAYFTHYETNTPFKVRFWDISAREVNYRTCSSDKYAAMLASPVFKVRPPVDPHFVPMDRPANPVPFIGVSGFVDQRSGRKGQRLVGSLAHNIANRARVVATGAGWPVSTQETAIEDLPLWYNGLDLFLCSSLIEGVPMPPLEALACGVPVVIPQDVGIMDELPDILGITRFVAGDYASMERAVHRALDERPLVDRKALVKAASSYTPNGWCSDHRAALRKVGKERHIEPVKAPAVTVHPVVKPAPKKRRKTRKRAKGRRGVYYVAFGDPSRECAQAAIASFKQYIPDIEVALVSDAPLGAGEDHFIHHDDFDIGGRLAKVRIYDLAPAEWQYIAYLDADTEIIAGETFLWEIVEDGWDMTICKNPARFHIAQHMRRPDNGDECDETFNVTGTDQIIQLNGGVFAFQRNERTEKFFHAWETEWMKYRKRDQAALLRALWHNPLKLYVLGNEWNTVTRYDSAETAAWLLHYPMLARRWRGVIHYSSDDPQAWRAVNNFMKERGK